MVRVQKEKIQSGQKKDKKFEGEGGVQVCISISRRGPVGPD